MGSPSLILALSHPYQTRQFRFSHRPDSFEQPATIISTRTPRQETNEVRHEKEPSPSFSPLWTRCQDIAYALDISLTSMKT